MLIVEFCSKIRKLSGNQPRKKVSFADQSSSNNTNNIEDRWCWYLWYLLSLYSIFNPARFNLDKPDGMLSFRYSSVQWPDSCPLVTDLALAMKQLLLHNSGISRSVNPLLITLPTYWIIGHQKFWINLICPSIYYAP